MKLPIEVSLYILGTLDRQTLGQVLVVNRRLSGIVCRHRKFLKLPKVSLKQGLGRLVLYCRVVSVHAVVWTDKRKGLGKNSLLSAPRR